MGAIYSDAEILALINEIKVLPDNFRDRIILRPKRGHMERELAVNGNNGNEFRIILRQSITNPIDFSTILVWLPPKSMTGFRLRRYNGRSHEHTNILESNRFYDFHVHQATERYQQSGLREDSFAEPTDRYQDYNSAISCLIKECGFQFSSTYPTELFEL